MSVSESSGGVAEVSLLRWIGYGLAAAGVVATVMRLFQPGPLWSGVLVVSAILTLCVLVRAPEAFETRWRGGGRGPNPLIAMPSAFLFFIALTDQVDDVTLPAAAAAGGAAVFLMAGMRALGRPGLNGPLAFQAMIALLGAGLGYGAVIALDVDFDPSPPAVIPVAVLDKYVTHGRNSTTYHLRVPEFGARNGPSSVRVSRADYNALLPGQSVCVLEHRGALGLSWVSAKRCD